MGSRLWGHTGLVKLAKVLSHSPFEGGDGPRGAYQVNHVRREEGDAVLLEEGLVRVKHAIEPREELLGAVVGVN